MKKVIAAVLFAAVVGGAIFLLRDSDRKVAVRAVTVERGDVVSRLVTNGRIEAGDRRDVVAASEGRVVRVRVELGAEVKRGDVLAELDSAAAQSEVKAAEARLAEADAALRGVLRGPSAQEQTEWRAALDAAQARAKRLQAEAAAVGRLIERQAAAPAEKERIEADLAQAAADSDLYQAKLSLKPAPEVVEQAEARAAEARAAVESARRRAEAGLIRAPASGHVYELQVRPGQFLRVGDIAARIEGNAGPRALIYVDEPELGRARLNDVVSLTADAYPGRSWNCRVDQLPLQVIELETRRVGEVRCSIEEPTAELIPNLLVNAEIRTAFAENVPRLPRELLTEAGGEAAVWTVDSAGVVRRTPVTLGVRGVDYVEVVSGLDAGDAVLDPGAAVLEEGRTVEVLP